jgi:hypothetical protein
LSWGQDIIVLAAAAANVVETGVELGPGYAIASHAPAAAIDAAICGWRLGLVAGAMLLLLFLVLLHSTRMLAKDGVRRRGRVGIEGRLMVVLLLLLLVMASKGPRVVKCAEMVGEVVL